MTSTTVFLKVTFSPSNKQDGKLQLHLSDAINICTTFDAVSNPATIHQLTFDLGNVELYNAMRACVKGVSLSKYASWLEILADSLGRNDFSDDTMIRLYLLNRVFHPVLSKVESIFQHAYMRRVLEKLNTSSNRLLDNEDVHLPFNMRAVLESNIFVIPAAIGQQDIAKLRKMSPLVIAHDAHGYSSLVERNEHDEKEAIQVDIAREIIENDVFVFMQNAIAHCSAVVRALLRMPNNTTMTAGAVVRYITSSPLVLNNMFVPVLNTALSLLYTVGIKKMKNKQPPLNALLIVVSKVLLPIATTLRICNAATPILLARIIVFETEACPLQPSVKMINRIAKSTEQRKKTERRRAMCAYLGEVKCNVCGMAYHHRLKQINIKRNRVRVVCATHQDPSHEHKEDFSEVDVALQLACEL